METVESARGRGSGITDRSARGRARSTRAHTYYTNNEQMRELGLEQSTVGFYLCTCTMMLSGPSVSPRSTPGPAPASLHLQPWLTFIQVKTKRVMYPVYYCIDYSTTTTFIHLLRCASFYLPNYYAILKKIPQCQCV